MTKQTKAMSLRKSSGSKQRGNKSKKNTAAMILKGTGTTYLISATPLNTGGFGAVYQATDEQGKVVAVKYYHSGIARESIEQECALQKYTTMRRIPHVCRYVDGPLVVGEHSYLVMEYIHGRSLFHLLEATRQQRWPKALAMERTRDFIQLATQIAQAVERLHAACVVHYDLKPDNIMIRQGTFEPVIVDLGLGCFKAACAPPLNHDHHPPDADLFQFQCTAHQTTFGYTAPELQQDDDHLPEDYPFEQADLYSLGKLFSDLSSGIMSDERSEDFERSLTRGADWVRDYDTLLPEWTALLRDLIFKSWFRRPSATEVVARLQRIVVKQPFPIFLRTV